MAQKINPTSVRAGKKFSWFLSTQNYGKTLIISNLFFRFILVLDLIKYLAKKILITDFNVIIKSNKINFDIFYFLNEKNYCLFKKKQVISLILKSWYFRFFNFRFFLKSKFYFSSFLIVSYLHFLTEKKFSLKKIVLIIISLLKANINSKKLILSKFGVKKVKLKGFKLCLIGRFENSKSQMANTYEYIFGTLPLLTLNNHIEFSSVKVFTKLGVCNIKIWLFFK